MSKQINIDDHLSFGTFSHLTSGHDLKFYLTYLFAKILLLLLIANILN